MRYDPAFMNTAMDGPPNEHYLLLSRDGDKGILRYRGLKPHEQHSRKEHQSRGLAYLANTRRAAHRRRQ
jgi:hypothetical protein